MRIAIPFLSLISLSVMFVACQKGDPGPAGATGATGATGPAGPAGAQGAKGDTGIANVVYSNWIPVTASSWVLDSTVYRTHQETEYDPAQANNVSKTQTDTFAFYHAIVSTPKVTQDILDKGLVYYYMKDSTPPASGSVNLFATTVVGVTNRQQSNIWHSSYSNYLDTYVSTLNNRMFVPQTGFEVRPADMGITKDSMKLATFWAGSSAAYDPNSYEHAYMGQSHGTIVYTELPPRTQFYIRYIVVAGTEASGRSMHVNYKDYGSVRTYYHLPD